MAASTGSLERTLRELIAVLQNAAAAAQLVSTEQEAKTVMRNLERSLRCVVSALVVHDDERFAAIREGSVPPLPDNPGEMP